MNHEKKAFKSIFWGLIFLIDIRLMGLIDVLPDVIGMLIVFKALKDLEQTAPSFYRAKRFMPVAIVLTGYEMIGPFVGGFMGQEIYWWTAVIQSIAILITNIYLMWLLTSGVREWALKKSMESLAKSAKRSGLYYGIVNLLGAAIMLVFSIIAPPIYQAIGLPLSFLYVVMIVMVVTLFKQASAIAEK